MVPSGYLGCYEAYRWWLKADQPGGALEPENQEIGFPFQLKKT